MFVNRKFNLGLVLMIALVLALGALVTGCGGKQDAAKKDEKAPAKQVTLKLAHESPASHAKGVWAEDFKKALEAKSAGRIKVELYHQGQLYANEQAALEAVRNNITQVSIASTGYMAGLEKKFQVFDLPMLFPGMDAFYKFQDGKIGQDLLGMLEQKGFVGLGYVSNVPLDAFTKKPLVSLDDFKGKKLRVHSATLELTVKALGGNPISMPASEVFMSMEQGVIDGLFTTVSYAAPNKFHEVAKHMTLCRVSAICYPVVISKKSWSELSKDDQKLVKEAVQEAVKKNRQELAGIEEKQMKVLKDGGITVHQLTPDQREKWLEKLSTVYDQVGAQVGNDFIKEVKDFVKKNS